MNRAGRPPSTMWAKPSEVIVGGDPEKNPPQAPKATTLAGVKVENQSEETSRDTICHNRLPLERQDPPLRAGKNIRRGGEKPSAHQTTPTNEENHDRSSCSNRPSPATRFAEGLKHNPDSALAGRE